MAFIDVDAALFCFLFYFKEPFFDAVLDRLSSSEDAVGGDYSVLFYLGILPAKGAGSAPGASRAPPAPLEPLSFLAARGVLCRRLRRRFRGGACPAVSKDLLFGGPRALLQNIVAATICSAG